MRSGAASSTALAGGIDLTESIVDEIEKKVLNDTCRSLSNARQRILFLEIAIGVLISHMGDVGDQRGILDKLKRKLGYENHPNSGDFFEIGEELFRTIKRAAGH